MKSDKFYYYIALLAVIQSFFIFSVFPLPFNQNLSKEELAKLEKGEVIIRNTGSIKNICLESDNEKVQQALKVIRDLDPSYLAEVIQIRPVTANEHIITELKPILTDIPAYIGIPYWSERHQKFFDLYSDGKIISRKDTGNTSSIHAILTMSPFGDIDTDISIDTSGDFLFYRNTNLNDLYYDKIKCVRQQNMKSIITVFKDGNNWILYGLGGVEAPKVFFLKNRIEVSFMNRIKTFCNFVFKKL
jgi:hypothetical protein